MKLSDPIDQGNSAHDHSSKSVYISTYGCQMNVNDTERMYSLLEMYNFTPVSSPDLADLILINSCSVREKPVHKVFSEVGTFKKLKQRKPHLKIGVGGCVGQQEKQNLMKKSPLIDFVFGTDVIDELPALVLKAYETQEKLVQAQFQHRSPYHIETLVRNPGVSTFVNIMKGCDNFCSFCVVPFTRGRERSRPLDQIVRDIQKLTQRGVKEVTLLGQNVNSYKSFVGDSNNGFSDSLNGEPVGDLNNKESIDFADLLKTLAEETDLQRIRFTTSHPKDFNEKLAQVMSKYSSKICEYIHLPFQCGSSRVLEVMNRGYTREEYIQKIKMIRSYLPQAVFSTDIIVGFPGETEEDFQETLTMIEEVGPETIYAFKYSPRPFTKAARFENQVPEAIKEDRLSRLFQFFDEWSQVRVQKYLDQTLEVLVESYDEKKANLTGRSTQNKSVYFLGKPDLIGQLVKVKINEAFSVVLRGELVFSDEVKID